VVLIILVVPCSEALVEARLQKASDELTFDNVTLNREEGDKVRTYPTVLTEFSSVVTDTQEYMAPADQVNSSGGVDVSQVKGGLCVCESSSVNCMLSIIHYMCII